MATENNWLAPHPGMRSDLRLRNTEGLLTLLTVDAIMYSRARWESVSYKVSILIFIKPQTPVSVFVTYGHVVEGWSGEVWRSPGKVSMHEAKPESFS
jgi:hypothetical protein